MNKIRIGGSAMKKKSQLFFLILLISAIFLTACTPSIEGTWKFQTFEAADKENPVFLMMSNDLRYQLNDDKTFKVISKVKGYLKEGSEGTYTVDGKNIILSFSDTENTVTLTQREDELVRFIEDKELNSSYYYVFVKE